MRPNSPWDRLYPLLNYLRSTLVCFSGALGALLKAPADQVPFLETSIRSLQSNAWWLLLLFAVAIGIASFFCSLIGSPKTWKTVKAHLDGFQETVFHEVTEDHLQAHRVTLFKWVRFNWRCWPWQWKRHPWSGWLIPIVRSGHTTQKSSTAFLAPDNADLAEGVAGKAWGNRRVVSRDNLPRIDSNSSDSTIRDYAKRAWVSEAWVRGRLKASKQCARSFRGIHVEVSGARWGVIVIDSIGETIPFSDESERTYRMLAKCLSSLLREIR
jgi:hypothetical protein